MGTAGLFVLFLLPVFAYAEVRITEIAWMGTEHSVHDEWIELYNTGEAAVDVTGWLLTDDENLEIELQGRIAPGEYVVLERTDESSAPSDAFLIYTGALSNEGRTLVLLRDDGTRADSVPGGSEWSKIGGDNEKKHTAQWTGSRWVTAPPTPGSAAVSKVDETDPSLPETSETKNTPKRAPGVEQAPREYGPQRPSASSTALVVYAGQDSKESKTAIPYALLVGVVALGVLGIYAERVGTQT